MTFQEFQCWLEGYEEGFNGKPPTAKQWERIKVKLGEVCVSPPATYTFPIQDIKPPIYPLWYTTCGAEQSFVVQ